MRNIESDIDGDGDGLGDKTQDSVRVFLLRIQTHEWSGSASVRQKSLEISSQNRSQREYISADIFQMSLCSRECEQTSHSAIPGAFVDWRGRKP